MKGIGKTQVNRNAMKIQAESVNQKILQTPFCSVSNKFKQYLHGTYVHPSKLIARQGGLEFKCQLKYFHDCGIH